jgi:hypothetical protein
MMSIGVRDVEAIRTSALGPRVLILVPPPLAKGQVANSAIELVRNAYRILLFIRTVQEECGQWRSDQRGQV